MKVNNKSLILLFLAFWVAAFGNALQAQTDDVYYDPSTDTPPPADFQTTTEPANVSRGYDDGDGQYDDDYYDYEDDYAYEYSSRIRRFHRQTVVYDYYDPFYTDLWVYDPFYLPGASIYVVGYDDYYTWRRWNRWNRYNSWNAWGGYNPYCGYGWNSWGWGGGWNSYNAWYNPYVCNNYYYDPYWTWNGYNPYYNSNVWVNNNYYYDNNNGHYNGYSPQTYTGPRRHGTSVNPGYVQIKDKSGRLNPDGKAPAVVELNGRPAARTPIESDREPVAKPGQVSQGRQTGTTPNDAVKAPQNGRPGATAGQPTEARPTQPGRQPQQDARPTEPQRQPTDARPSREPQQQQRQPQQQPQREPRPQQEAPRPSRRSYDQPREETRPTRTQEPQQRREETRPTRTQEPQQRREETRPTRTQEPQQRTMDRPTRSSDSGSNSSSRSSGGSSNSGGSTKSTSGRGGRN